MIVPSGIVSPISSALLQPTANPLALDPGGAAVASGVRALPGVLSVNGVKKGVAPVMPATVGSGVIVSKGVGLVMAVGGAACAVCFVDR